MIYALDTDILIDILRKKPEAQTWLEQNKTAQFVIPGIVAMEIINGSQNKTDLQQNKSFLSRFQIIWSDDIDMKVAYALLGRHRLAVAIGIPDCIIAAMCLRRSHHLLTFNLKHYRHVDGLSLSVPYTKN